MEKGLLAAGFVACSEWTVPERETFENQENLEKYIPLLEAESEADLTPSMRDYFAKLNPRKSPFCRRAMPPAIPAPATV